VDLADPDADTDLADDVARRIRNGTLPLADGPRVPVSIATTSCPDSASSALVLTGRPTSPGSGWLNRVPVSSVTTTYNASVARR